MSSSLLYDNPNPSANSHPLSDIPNKIIRKSRSLCYASYGRVNEYEGGALKHERIHSRLNVVILE